MRIGDAKEPSWNIVDASPRCPQGKPHGMSMADRACLALGIQRKCRVLTAEKQMGLAALPIKVKLIRNAH
jgi:PIN domain nuclease of toxin-antitoxin system